MRWCTAPGLSQASRDQQQVIPTGAEGKTLEFQRAEAERQKADQLAARLRELGINPDEI